MPGKVQARVQIRLDRLAELERKYAVSHITVAEAREIFRLRDIAAKRRSNDAWLSRGDNRQRAVEMSRQWRQANPGCC